ncbi:type 2 isopentenyl-diphosphate Delta-isomerase [Rhodohalobacter sp. SW132]|uniref:type 2 isopentenyl-diphosphate Delta-isomerase n=1 Tax=Rhodohalobacter sp. SW132 TaxID=2293433 RepID=UPI000E278944|nr:type 2 isopentenyl-diphosphate Delta-isomerase [Rhodohalobacter sp. SW132]REL33714.1 type 2 isopentenyl-diphosphate Delta-isomerase [Rhodohalobacter sp. SW132]
MSIQERKKDHVDLCVNEDVNYSGSAGFEQYQFRHNALPELNLEDISTETSLLGRSFSFPLFLSSMTGGYTDAGQINAQIARFCEKNNLPFGVGSQRALLDHPEEINSFSVVRNEAPTAFIAANIGGAQIAGGLTDDQLEVLIESIQADAIIVHLNPLQELVQPEGDRAFRGIESGIRKLVIDADLPIIVKETGAGITGEVARRLLAAGVSVIDVAGSGGTSWAKVENLRKADRTETDFLNDWGMPTTKCLEEVALLREEFRFELISSGGLRTASDIMKSFALGANFTAMAGPVIRALVNGGEDELQKFLNRLKEQLKQICLLLGRRAPAQCSHRDLIKK